MSDENTSSSVYDFGFNNKFIGISRDKNRYDDKPGVEREQDFVGENRVQDTIEGRSFGC